MWVGEGNTVLCVMCYVCMLIAPRDYISFDC